MARSITPTEYELGDELTLTYSRKMYEDGHDVEPQREVEVTVTKISEITGGIFLAGEREEYHIHADGSIYGRRLATDARRVQVGSDAELTA